MASHSCKNLQILLCCLLLIFSTTAKKTPSVKTLVLPVTKAHVHGGTDQHVLQIKKRIPRLPMKLTVDISLDYPFFLCEEAYAPINCTSPLCLYATNGACLSTNACAVYTFNSIGGVFAGGELYKDIVSVKSIDGRLVSVPDFLFMCTQGDAFSGKGLASGAQGMAGFGVSNISFSYQLAKAYGLKRKFAICLSPLKPSSHGVIFVGDGPYVFQPAGIDVSKSLTYTPLITHFYYKEFFLLLKAIMVNDNLVPSAKWKHKLIYDYDGSQNGGTKIGTIQPYTVMDGDVHASVVDEFVKALGNQVHRVDNATPPFDVCFNSTTLGPAVPTISLVFENGAVWKTYGANSMVQVSQDVTCLAIVSRKGGFTPYATVEIGSYQLEDNLVQFDLDNNRLGFSSPLLSKHTACSNFNFK